MTRIKQISTDFFYYLIQNKIRFNPLNQRHPRSNYYVHIDPSVKNLKNSYLTIIQDKFFTFEKI